ncbi:MAG: Ig-like domain-containing protein [Leptospiraceae bacterium]|nr:Ig-like domain-containing protein [Leptospiraceae bacterium]
MNTNDMQANPNLTEKQPVVVKKYSGLTLPAIVLLCLLIGVGGCKEEDLELLLLPDGGRQPSVLATNPNNDTVGLNSSEEIWVLFSDTMDQEKTQDAFRLSSGTGNVDGSYSWEGNRMVFQPREPLSGAGEFTMVVGRQSESSYGVDLQDEVIVRFYANSDITRPRFVSSTPANGDTNVSTATSIVLNFSEPIDFSTVGDGISISPSFLYTVSQSSDKKSITFLPSSALTPGTYVVTLNSNLEDTSGNELQNETTITFIVGSDFIPPAILSVVSGAVTLQNGVYTTGVERNNPIVVTFSEPMNTVAAENAISISPFVASGKVWNGTNDVLTITYNPSLDPETDYTFGIDATAADTLGNGLGQNYSYPFHTNGVLSLRPQVLNVQYALSSAPAVDNSVVAGYFATPLSDFSVLDVSQLWDADATPGSTDYVIQLRITFNNNMVRNNLITNTSFSKIYDPTTTSVSIHSIGLAGNVMTLNLSGTWAAHAASEVPVWRLRINQNAFDVNGNTMVSNYNLYLTY